MEVLWAIQEATGIPHDEMRVTDGRNLYPGRTLESFGNFCKEKTLHMTRRVTPELQAHLGRKPPSECRLVASDEAPPFIPRPFVPPPPGADEAAACRGSGFEGVWGSDDWEDHLYSRATGKIYRSSGAFAPTDLHAAAAAVAASATAISEPSPPPLDELFDKQRSPMAATSLSTRRWRSIFPTPCAHADTAPSPTSRSLTAITPAAGSAVAATVVASLPCFEDAFADALIGAGSPAMHLLNRLLHAQAADGSFSFPLVLRAMATGPDFITPSAGPVLLAHTKAKLDAALSNLPAPFRDHPALTGEPAVARLLALALLEAHCTEGKAIWSVMTRHSVKYLTAAAATALKSSHLSSVTTVQAAVDALAAALRVR